MDHKIIAQDCLLRLLPVALLMSAPNGIAYVNGFDMMRFSSISDNRVDQSVDVLGRDIPGSTLPAPDGRQAQWPSIRPVARPENSNYNSLFLASHGHAIETSSSIRLAAKMQTKIVHLSDPPKTAISTVACGGSPATADEIRQMVIDRANRYGVDPGFALAIAWTESRFDRIRNSPRGARGPMQLMPDTAARFGVADVCDPSDNIDGGVRYLRALLDEFKNPLIAAAAYNAGETAIYAHGGVPDFPETVRYVATVINRALGLQLPAGRNAMPRHRVLPADVERSAVDVIGAHASGFVNGVMQFPSKRSG